MSTENAYTLELVIASCANITLRYTTTQLAELAKAGLFYINPVPGKY